MKLSENNATRCRVISNCVHTRRRTKIWKTMRSFGSRSNKIERTHGWDSRTSARLAAQELGHKCETVHMTLKGEGYLPYRISVLHELKGENYAPQYNYCSWFFEKFGRNVEKMTTMFYTDKAWFHLSGYGIIEYGQTIIPTPSKNLLRKVGIWCTVSKRRVIGPIIFDRSADIEVYTKIIQDFIALLEPEAICLVSTRRSNCSHGSKWNESYFAIFWWSNNFKRVTASAKSGLISTRFFLAGLLKDNVYRNKPLTSDDLKKETETRVHAIDENTRKRVFRNMIKRLDACQGIRRGQFQH